MSDTDTLQENKTAPTSPLVTAVNIFTAPGEAFASLEQRPSKLFPIATILLSMMAVMFWYYSMMDFDWFIDDTLAGANLEGEELEAARETMASMSQTTFRLLGMFGGPVSLLVIWTLQAGYLSLAAALAGYEYKFSHWFSLTVWTGLPSLLSITGMAVTILLSPNGQLSAYDLDPTTLANLGMQFGDTSVQSLMRSINLTMIWGTVLILLGFKQWSQASWLKSASIVLAPYLVILGVWAFFALS